MKSHLINIEDNQFRILSILEAKPEISQRHLAEKLGLSLGAVNYCIKSLIQRGAVKVENFKKSDNKLAYAYLLTPVGIAEKVKLTENFLLRRLQEFYLLQVEIEQVKLQMKHDSKKFKINSELKFNNGNK